MKPVTYIADKLTNLVANLGTSRDKLTHSEYTFAPLTDNELLNAYRGSWMPRKIVDIPAFDSVRRWRDWQAESKEITKIEALEMRLGLRQKVLQAMIKARLYGGAGIYISTNSSDVMKPMRPDEKIQFLTVITRRRLTAGPLSFDPASPGFGQPTYYELADTGVRLHPSRLVLFVGSAIPDDELISPRDAGWGDSVLQSTLESVKQADSSLANVASMIFEAKVDVIKIPDFMVGLQDPEYEQQVLNRLRLAAQAKGVNGTLILDSLEEYSQKSLAFSSLGDLIDRFLQVVSGACDIPATRFLGASPDGLNSTGESDIRNYYDMISSEQELIITPAMSTLDQLIVNNALGGEYGRDAWYGWSPLWQPTSAEHAEIGEATANMIKTLSDTMLFPPDALSKAAVTVLSERGALPGLEQAVEEYPMETDDLIDETGGDQLTDRMGVYDGEPKTLYVSRRVVNVEDFTAWAERNDVILDDNLHVTVAYSRAPVRWQDMGRAWGEERDGTLLIRPGGPRELTVFNSSALVLEFYSEDLSWRWESMMERGASWDWDSYKPHVTLSMTGGEVPANASPYTGPIVLGPEIFEEIK